MTAFDLSHHLLLARPHSLMDRTAVSGAAGLGSIPGGATSDLFFYNQGIPAQDFSLLPF